MCSGGPEPGIQDDYERDPGPEWQEESSPPTLGLEIQQLKVRQLSHVPASRPKIKKKKKNQHKKTPPKPWAEVLTAMTRQSSSASAKQRKGESNHQNWSPSNPMMLFIAPGMFCSIQQTSKMPLTALCTRGTGEVWRGPVQAPRESTDLKQEEQGMQGQSIQVAVTHGRTYFLQGHIADL